MKKEELFKYLYGGKVPEFEASDGSKFIWDEEGVPFSKLIPTKSIVYVGNPDDQFQWKEIGTLKGPMNFTNPLNTPAQLDVYAEIMAAQKLVMNQSYSIPAPYLSDADLQAAIAKEASPYEETLKKMAFQKPEWQATTETPGPSEAVFFVVKDANGKTFKLPVKGIPQFTTNYSLADSPETFIEHADIEIDSIVVEYHDGGPQPKQNIIAGPFMVKGSYTKSPYQHPDVIKPKSITIEHNGMFHMLQVGDTFTVNYNVDLDGKSVFDHNETVTVKEFNYDYGQPVPAPHSPSPFALNYEGEKSEKELGDKLQHNLKLRNIEEVGQFTYTWLPKQEIFLIGGHQGDKRYEIVLGQVIPPGEWDKALGIDYSDLPISLRSMISSCNRALANHISDKTQVFKHPKLHEIQVKCPGKTKIHKHAESDCENRASLYDMIQHVNDTHKWSREAIAEWIDTLDEQPVFYPIIESQRVANSAKVVKLEPPV